MQDINLLEELNRAQQEVAQKNLVNEALDILSIDASKDSEIRHRLYNHVNDSFDGSLNKLDSSRIFDQESIEAVSVKFRLRFLESQLFKSDIPAEAIHHIKHVEAKTGIRFDRFKIVAPAERFQLFDSTKDPVLFAELPNGKYYYVYQWGDDMSGIQRILKYPFRHMKALAFTSIFIGAIIALSVPSLYESFKAEFFYRFFMFSMTSSLLMTLAIIVGIMYSKDFSENVWNSKYIK